MDRLKMQSRDVVGGNVEKIAALFPQCVTERLNKEGKPELAIDFDKLRAELSNDTLEDGEERYQFTWPDKRAASRLANEPVNLTLRPCREESVGKDGTPGGFDSENLYIEGDNLDVLKVLRETYLGRVKMIYIDPPYNTGNDFVYNDNFAQGKEDFEQNSGLFDAEGNQTIDPMQRNTEANGRFHTDWLNMIYPRLKVARDLLSDDGVIFISMDDNEAKNLKAVCDEIFGSQNFLAQVVWERAYSPINLMKHFSPSHDYILVYAKNQELAECRGIPRSQEANDRYSNPDNDPRGPWKPSDLSVGPAVESNIYPITTPSGRIVEPPAARSWRLSRNAFRERLQDNRIWFGPNGDSVPSMKRFLSELRKTGITPMTIWKYTEVDHSQAATQKLAKLFDGKKYFDYPKPVELLKRCLALYTSPDECIVLDFFSGSGTFAQAVMELNANDGGKRKYILVQAPEKMENPANVELKFETIPQFAEERIRRAGEQIRRDAILRVRNDKTAGTATGDLFDDMDSERTRRIASLPDTGFRVLKLDSSNMEDVFYTPDAFEPSLLDGLVDNIKADRTGEDLLFQVMLDLGIELSAKIERKEIAGKEVFSVDDDYLLACFDTDVNETTIEEMAKLLPTHLVIRDASAANDNVLDNFDQIIESYSNEKKITTHIL
ncbi:MAG: site-specific DNA-methyltransferase [Muribaculaceae bacterium]|nr:site-specific DNA-methyltransferase [Muribaculaceae bacterium]